MRKDAKALAGRIRRAVGRLVMPGDVLGLSVFAAGRDAAAGRISVRLRGPERMCGGALLALERRLRGLLRLSPGAALPILVIQWVSQDMGDAAGETRPEAPARDAALPKADGTGWRAAEDAGAGARVPVMVPARLQEICSAALQKERRRSRSPPSPLLAVFSAGG